MLVMQGGDRYLTIEEVATQLNVCRASIYLWLKRGFPQPVKFGRASRWRSSEIDAWVRACPRGVYGEGHE